MKNKEKLKYSWKEFDVDCQILAHRIKTLKIEVDEIYGVPRGGLVVAVALSHLLNKPLNLTGILKKNTLIVDDISDGGHTLLELNRFSKYNTATLWIDNKTKFMPTIYCNLKGEKDWIVFPWEQLTAKTKKDN